MLKRVVIILILLSIGIISYISVPNGNSDIQDRKLNEIHIRYIENQLDNYNKDEIIITHIIGDENGKKFARDIGQYLSATGRVIKEKTSYNIYESKQGQFIGLNDDGIMEINIFRKGYYEG